jgi:uridine phosphorylase
MNVRFTPRMYMDHYAAQRGITVEDIGVAPIVVVSWAPGVVRRLGERTSAEVVPHWPWRDRYLFYTGEIQGKRVSYAQVGVGAPNTVASMEQMIACGACAFIGLGWAGSLHPSAPIGTCLIPTTCIREEGTSPHYVEDDTTILPNDRLVELLMAAAQVEGVDVVSGPHWTTDAPYREFNDKIEAYGHRGILGVDMETSAMYALGCFREVAVCNLLVISDELWQVWKPAYRTPELKAATRSAERVVLRALAGEALLP